MARIEAAPNLIEGRQEPPVSQHGSVILFGFLRPFRRNSKANAFLAVALIAAIAIADWRLKENVPLGFLYLMPMLMLGRVLKPWQILGVAALCTYLTEEFDSFAWDFRNGIPRDLLYLIAFFAIGVFVHQVSRNRRVMIEQIAQTERQTAARFEAEQQLKALVETSPAAIVTTDFDGCILMANDAAHRLLEVEQPLLLGRKLQSYFPSFSHLTKRETSQQLFRTMMQSRGHRECGEGFLAEICFSTYQTASGLRLAAMILDSSEEFRAREEASLHQMLAGSRIAVNAVSHEIRNVCGAIAAVHQNLASNSRVAGDADFEALGNLIAALERIAAVELRPYPEQALELDLPAMLDDLKIVVAPLMDDHGITLAINVESSLPRVWADGTNLMQVFLNLTTNSIRALSESKTGRTLTVNAKRAGGRVLVEIIDSGGGVADTTQLFRPFQEGARNTGLGLYLARAFARSFGGDLRYQAVPGGSCFVVELAPVQEVESSCS